MTVRAFARGALALVVLSLTMHAQTACAVDRSLGAAVPKPAATGVPWSADAIDALKRDLDSLLDGAPTLHGAHVGLLAIDTATGNGLYARNPDDAFVPASTLKLLTGSAALALLGPTHRFRTQALFDPLSARLFIRGGGDPLLRAADLDTMASAVRAARLGDLKGGVWIDASAFEQAPYPPGWCWDDFPFDYAAPVSAATIEENVVHLSVAPAAAAGATVIVRATPAAVERSVGTPIEGCPLTRTLLVIPQARTAPAGAADTVDIARTTGGCILVTGALPLDASPDAIDAAVPSPVRYMRAIALHALQAAGITPFWVSGVAGPVELSDGALEVQPGSRLVWTHAGEPLSDLLADMWWPSDNLVAEVLLREIGRQTAGLPGTSAHGVTAEQSWLTRIGVDPATLTVVDGSGLSSYDRVTPRALVAILQADWNGPYRDTILDDLPLAGVRGTTASDFKGTLAEGRTFAKTGSMNHTRGFAGYLATLHHGAVTFAWSIDDWMGTPADLDALRARVLSRLIGD